MVEILGLPLRTFLSRLGGAIVTGVISLIVFLYVPQVVYSRIPSFGGALGIPFTYFVYYAVFITILSGISTVYRNHFLGDAAAITNGLAQIVYIYLITNGGLLSVAVGSATLSVDYSSLLYLLMMPSALGVVSSIIRMISRSAMRPYIDREEIKLR
jgi:hypothetical protein